MARQYRDDGNACGERPAALRRFVATVFAVVCIVGPAMAWTWDVGTKRIVSPPRGVDSGTAVVPMRSSSTPATVPPRSRWYSTSVLSTPIPERD